MLKGGSGLLLILVSEWLWLKKWIFSRISDFKAEEVPTWSKFKLLTNKRNPSLCPWPIFIRWLRLHKWRTYEFWIPVLIIYFLYHYKLIQSKFGPAQHLFNLALATRSSFRLIKRHHLIRYYDVKGVIATNTLVANTFHVVFSYTKEARCFNNSLPPGFLIPPGQE